VTESNKYPAQVFFSEEDEGFIAIAPDLPGCSAFGATQEEALAELQVAIDVWRGAAAKAGNPIPPPSKPQTDPLPSGKVLVRMPRSLHGRLNERAKAEDVSLNQLIVHLLSGVVSVQATASENVWKFATSRVVQHLYETGMLVATANVGTWSETVQVTDPHLTSLTRMMAQPNPQSLIVYQAAGMSGFRASPAPRRLERAKHG
jgi:predicted RNase H-like HicB family nuclease